MGWVTEGALQGLVTVSVLGAFKRGGLIRIHPENVQNANARKLFEAAIWVGDSIVEKSVVAFGEAKRLVAKNAPDVAEMMKTATEKVKGVTSSAGSIAAKAVDAAPNVKPPRPSSKAPSS
ncbi:hypothetical protein CBR_g31841 [Chara braunii]|uniref:Uncharacterized protein n=1 Tax=Chara braunii TaxID=69332 RepID=A0A388LFS3_CHABU|nr:hypothetical protein CBR_g31841 [Chara braunii]|eukprot:GBG81165.1 hypothetical protein CBR_g31841 [Chara braunii]